ncbi:MAG: tetratricopeptide repeat protein [Alphaproteobacteria bacterium]|nr:tetratricopeptide repeat protein [Alphaproteobacteria bacterium]
MTRIRQPLIAIRNKIRLALVAICLSFLAFTASAAAAEFDVSLHEMQSLLRAGDFDALEKILTGLEEAYEAGEISDTKLEHAHYAFGSADPDLESSFSDWIKARPQSHHPYLARGIYHRYLGWMLRGADLPQRTPDERMALMTGHFELAASDLTTVLERKPNSGLAYSFLVDITLAVGRRDILDTLLRAGLKADPNSFTLRRRYFGALTPWWGGGRTSNKDRLSALGNFVLGAQNQQYPVRVTDSMRSFTREIVLDAPSNPALQPLRGYLDFSVAEILRRNGRNLDAIKYYDKAIASGDYWYFRYQEGKNYYWMERYRDAIASYDRALELWPDNPGTLERSAQAYRRLELYNKANADLDLALSLDPKNPDILREKAYTLRDSGRYEEAVSVLDDAFIYGEFDDFIWDARGRLYLYELKDPKRAIPDLKRTTELDPANQRYWSNYGRALYAARDCKAVDAFKKYLAVCPRFGNDCRESSMKFAREVIEYMSHPGHCGN